jgi:outer membrane protein insertion porin family
LNNHHPYIASFGKNGIIFPVTMLLLVLLASCSVKKHLRDGDYLYDGATIKINQDTIKVDKSKLLVVELKSMVRPSPNKKILGRRQKLWYYYAAGETTKEKGLKHWLKYKLGEPPVLMQDVYQVKTATVLENNLENNGFFFAKVKGDTSLNPKKKIGKASYIATPGYRYTLKNIYYPTDSTRVGRLVKESESESLFKKGTPYNFETLKRERLRIDEYLKQRGYYFFDEDYLLMRADTTIGNHEINLFVTVKRETPRNALIPWSINKVFVYPDYESSSDSINVDSSYLVDKFYLVNPKNNFKPNVFERVISFEPNEIYNREDHNKTLSRLVNLGAFKFVRNRFDELPFPSDTGKLDAFYYLAASKRRNLRLETTGKTSSASMAGLELNLNWRNRNLFRGAEQLNLKVYGGFDIQFGGENKGYNIYSFGAEGSISWPRMVPINFTAKDGSFVPFTRLSISNEWQRRQKLYTVNTLKAAYSWAWRPSLRTEHFLTPFQATFVDNKNVSQEYLDQIKQDSSLARIIEEQLIVGPEYTYIYNFTVNPKKPNGWYYKANLGLSNTILGLVQGADAKNNDVKTLLNVEYNQFIKTEQELRYYRKLSPRSTNLQWVNRLNIGIGIPYGNSLQLPYIKQFYTGGSNSLRAFRARSVGPGGYSPNVTPDGFVPDLVGDIKLEMNSEFRTKLAGMLHGAIFIDAGNIWLFNENALIPDGAFSKNFMKEMAVGAGVGLRFDVAGIFMIRLDTAIPLRKPSLPEGERWVIKDIEIWRGGWKKENIILNLAVGLPF